MTGINRFSLLDNSEAPDEFKSFIPVPKLLRWKHV